MILRTAFALASLAALGAAAPDEVKLKSGREYKNLKLEKETKTDLHFVDLSGQKVVIPKANVETHTPKPTVREELEAKRAAMATPDAKGLVKLARWAQEQEGLLDKEAGLLFEEALKADPNDEDARKALGYVRKDGQWFSPEEDRKAREKEYAARARLAGGKETKGRWMLPSDVAKQELKLVEHEGFWVTKERKEQIVAKRLHYAEGDWITGEEKEEFDKGMRKNAKGAWKKAEELDPEHAKWPNAWSLKGRWVEVRTIAPHERGRFALKTADEAAGAIVKWSGVEPNVYGKGGLLLVVYGAKVGDYVTFGQGVGAEWPTARYNTDGMFYSVQSPFEKDRGATITYDNPTDDYDMSRYWLRRGALEAFVGRFTNPEKLDERILDAYAAYFSCFKGERFAPNWFLFARYFRKESPFKSVGEILTKARRDPKLVDPSLPQSGFFLHYMTSQNPDATKAAFLKMLAGTKVTPESLWTDVFGDKKADEVEKSFESFLKTYRDNFRPSDK